MQKQTLQFPDIENLAAFVRQLEVGYLINTNKLTLTGDFPREDMVLAQNKYGAEPVETTEKTFQY